MRSTFSEAAAAWLVMFEAQVERGTRSPSTLDEYRHVIKWVVDPGVGALRLGEVSTPRLDRFVQGVLVERGYATAKLTRTVLSGVCGWLVRRGALGVNPVRELTPLEQDRDRRRGRCRRWRCGGGWRCSTVTRWRGGTICPSWRGSCSRPGFGWVRRWG